MQVNGRYDLTHLCDPEHFHEQIRDPYLDGDRLVATDGHVLLAVPVERAAGDVDGVVPAGALDFARIAGSHVPEPCDTCDACDAPAAPVPPKTLTFACPAEAVLVEGGAATFARPQGRPFPDWRASIPAGPPSATLTLNVGLLVKLARALGVADGFVTLVRYAADGPIQVVPQAPMHPPEPGLVALLMPARPSHPVPGEAVA